MIFSLFSLSVILTLATTSHSLSCIECTDTSDFPCTGDVKTCLPDEVCLSRYTTISVRDLSLSKYISRGCGNRTQCSYFRSVSITRASVLSSASCCFTSLCTPPPPPAIVSSETPEDNSIECKICKTMVKSPYDSDSRINSKKFKTK